MNVMHGVDSCKKLYQRRHLKEERELFNVHKEDNKHDGFIPKTVDRSLTGRHRQICKNNKQAVLPVHAMKAYKWCRGIDPLILYLDTEQGGWFDALAALSPRKNPCTH